MVPTMDLRSELVKEIRRLEQCNPNDPVPEGYQHESKPGQTIGELVEELKTHLLYFDPWKDN